MNSCKDCSHKQMCMWKRFIEEAEKGVEESMNGIKEKYQEFPVKLDLISTCSFYSSQKKDPMSLSSQVQNVPTPNFIIASSLQSSYYPYMPCCCENTSTKHEEPDKLISENQNSISSAFWDQVTRKKMED